MVGDEVCEVLDSVLFLSFLRVEEGIWFPSLSFLIRDTITYESDNSD